MGKNQTIYYQFNKNNGTQWKFPLVLRSIKAPSKEPFPPTQNPYNFQSALILDIFYRTPRNTTKNHPTILTI